MATEAPASVGGHEAGEGTAYFAGMADTLVATGLLVWLLLLAGLALEASGAGEAVFLLLLVPVGASPLAAGLLMRRFLGRQGRPGRPTGGRRSTTFTAPVRKGT